MQKRLPISWTDGWPPEVRRARPRNFQSRLLAVLLLTTLTARPESIWDNENMIANRKYRVHDLVTIIVKEQTRAQTRDTSDVRRRSTHDLDLLDFFGIKGRGFRDGGGAGRRAIRYQYEAKRDKEGELTHREDFTARLTARIIEVLPNGNLVLEARKTVRIGEEESTVVFSGEVRPRDVSLANTVLSDYVADARIEYRGRGAVTDAIRRGWLTRLFDFANLF